MFANVLFKRRLVQMLKKSSKHDQRKCIKIFYNKKSKLVKFDLAHNGKKNGVLVAASFLTELACMLTTMVILQNNQI